MFGKLWSHCHKLSYFGGNYSQVVTWKRTATTLFWKTSQNSEKSVCDGDLFKAESSITDAARIYSTKCRIVCRKIKTKRLISFLYLLYITLLLFYIFFSFYFSWVKWELIRNFRFCLYVSVCLTEFHIVKWINFLKIGTARLNKKSYGKSK